MKILIITPRIPYPPYRGDKLKIFNIAKHLVKNNYIKILTFYRTSRQLEDIENLKKYNIPIEAVKLSVFDSLFKVLIAIFSSFPFQVAWFQSSKMKHKVNLELEKGNYDVAYFHLIRSAQYLNSSVNSDKSVKVIDFTDAVSLYLKRFSEIERNLLKKLFIYVEKKRIEEYEKITEKFHTLFICSEIDKNYLQERGIKANVRILRNGIDTEYFGGDKKSFNNHRIIFTGNMPYYANYDAAIYFSKEIFPDILNKEPKAEFYIVGQKPPLKIKRLSSKNIFVTGFVKDIKDEYLKSAVNVAPMRFGAGTLNKVLESISLGIPVVATELAVLGLPKKLNKYIFIAKNSQEFSEKVIYIFNNPSIRNELMEEGKEIIRRLLSWDRIVTDFELYLKEQLNLRAICPKP